jgi:hypothetical protein
MQPRDSGTTKIRPTTKKPQDVPTLEEYLARKSDARPDAVEIMTDDWKRCVEDAARATWKAYEDSLDPPKTRAALEPAHAKHWKENVDDVFAANGV